ncbi:MAG: hypothetical protein ABIS50_10940 [Luteolibacter sp.]|uniref:hypothetical protein n=1 Tax=Luteolibacter sp. TaxID=1962973 RepID=UPI00326488FE
MNEPPIKPNREWPGSRNLACEPVAKPPVNRAVAWFRVILWILPAGFAVLSAWGVVWYQGHLIPHRLGVLSWVVVNVIFVLGTGWYHALLSISARSEPRGIFARTILFFFIQLFLIPLLASLALFLGCLIGTIKF